VARYQKSGAQRAKPDDQLRRSAGRRPASTPAAIEDTMFFPRLRRHAKWMFVFLAVVFALGFVGFGVGAGGVGFGDVLRDIGGGGGPSVGDAREKTEKRPNDAAAWEELSQALQADADTAGAIDAQKQVVLLRPKDPDALRTLAGLQISVISDKQALAQAIQSNAMLRAPTQSYPSLTVDGQAVIGDPIGQAINQQAISRVQVLQAEAQAAASGAVEAYRKLVALQPNDPGARLELAQAAQQTGDYQTAIAAYEKFLALAPEDPSVSVVKQQIQQLRQALGASG
jgi:hypothetical protein